MKGIKQSLSTKLLFERDQDFKPDFPGPFHTWSVVFNRNEERNFVERFLVFSVGKQGTVNKYLWHKLVWDQLSRKEFFLFLSLPNTLMDPKMHGFLRAKMEVPLRVLRKRLNHLEALTGEKETSLASYQGYRSQRLTIYLDRRNLHRKLLKTKRVKSPSQVGTKSSGKILFIEPLAPTNFQVDNEFAWYSFLTVGEIPLLGGNVTLSLKRTKKFETV